MFTRQRENHSWHATIVTDTTTTALTATATAATGETATMIVGAAGIIRATTATKRPITLLRAEADRGEGYRSSRGYDNDRSYGRSTYRDDDDYRRSGGYGYRDDDDGRRRTRYDRDDDRGFFERVGDWFDDDDDDRRGGRNRYGRYGTTARYEDDRQRSTIGYGRDYDDDDQL